MNTDLTMKTATATALTSSALALSAVTLSVLAPAGPAYADGGTMPDVTGRPLVAAYQALDYDTTVRFADGRGARRLVLWPGSWKVCGQSPRPGTPLDGRRVTLTVVKHSERCGTGTG
ncbi:PASTA domain-containing protein [Streptomyces sp. NPDC001339]|uniref:PASTA domain-containing protein n=1 Tax=Streptomyces sp. NPDC001339 TaxID=3364563 RepID=UPI0036CFBCA7